MTLVNYTLEETSFLKLSSRNLELIIYELIGTKA